jgi:hydrogenase expression/formation protein HypC
VCLGVPGRILDRWQEADGQLLAHADFVGEVRVIRLNYLPSLDVGDYTIVHAGYALTRIDEAEAAKTVALMREVELLEPPQQIAQAKE